VPGYQHSSAALGENGFPRLGQLDLLTARSGRSVGLGSGRSTTSAAGMSGLLDEFLGRIGRRDAHLRSGIQVQRIWRRADAADLGKRSALPVRSALRSAGCWRRSTSRCPRH